MPRTLRADGALHTRLLALVLIPLLGVGAFTAIEIHSRVENAASARHAESLLTSATRIAAVRSGLLAEVVPSMAMAIIRTPAIAAALNAASVSMAELGLSVDTVAALRAQTDRAITDLARDERSRSLGATVRAQVRTMRADIDSGTRISRGYDQASAIVERLTAAQHGDNAAALRTGLGSAGQSAVRDLERVTQVTGLGEQELPLLAGSVFPVLGSGDTSPSPELIQQWLQTWGGYQAAYGDLIAQGAKPLVRALRAATSTPAARSFDASAAAIATAPTTIGAGQLVTLYRTGEQRSAALAGVLQLAVSRATDAATAQRDSADDALWTLVVAGLALLVLSVAAVWAVLRSINAPLRSLADSARKVSEGVLEDVPICGPQEVQTAAKGLDAAVAILRNIEAQATAVAAGKLDDEVLRTPLPGPLGQVMHASVETIIGAIHERDAAQTDLAYRAAHDSLTGLVNRAQAMHAIDAALHRARRAGSMTALMFVDLDRFKTVNDSFGHGTGDVVLVTAARRMLQAVRAGDTVARLGGDEFLILLEDVRDGSAPVTLAERLVRELAEPVELAGRELRVGASIGVATCTDGGVEAERLLGEADAAAYRAKNDGRGRVSVFDDSLRAELAGRYELDAAISTGLAAGEFELYYQPIVDLRSGQPYGAEALIRWNRPGHGLVPPDEFIPAAELSRRINDIGRWTLLEALAQLARWDAEADGAALAVSVNISGRHLAGNELIPDVRHALAEADIAPGRLTVEVTETFLVSDPGAMQNLVTLRDMGVRVALDDFGTGFTSVRQLRYLPIDCIKIDRSFIVSTDPAERELVQLMANAAQAFGVDVVAEGIEGPEHLAVPLDAGIIGAQGYYFSRPVPAAQAIGLLRARRLPVSPSRLPTGDRDVRAAL